MSSGVSLEPGSSTQWMFAVARHVEHPDTQYYGVSIRLDGLGTLDGPFGTWDEAAEAIRTMAKAVEVQGGGFATTGEYKIENGMQQFKVRHHNG